MSIFHDTLVSKMCCTRFSCTQKGLVNGDWEGLQSQDSAGLVVPCFLAQCWCLFTCPWETARSTRSSVTPFLRSLWWSGFFLWASFPWRKQAVLAIAAWTQLCHTLYLAVMQSTLLVLLQVNMSFIFLFLLAICSLFSILEQLLQVP